MLTGNDVNVYAFFLVAPIFIMKRHFGAIFLGDLILWRSKFFAKLFWWFLKIGELFLSFALFPVPFLKPIASGVKMIDFIALSGLFVVILVIFFGRVESRSW